MIGTEKREKSPVHMKDETLVMQFLAVTGPIVILVNQSAFHVEISLGQPTRSSAENTAVKNPTNYWAKHTAVTTQFGLHLPITDPRYQNPGAPI